MTLASGAFHRSERNTPTRATSASTIDPHKGDDVMANHPAGSEPRTGTAAFDAGSGVMPSWSELVSEHADGVTASLFA